jgi:hypothetical protein
MGGGFDRLRQGLNFTVIMLCGLGLVVCAIPTRTSAQNLTAKGPHCFAIQVHLNGQPIGGPQAVTLKTHKMEDTVALKDSCFPLPSAVLESELIEVSFTVPGNSIRVSDVPTDFFSGQWVVELADKKFSHDVPVPKHANVSEVCAVAFHGSDTEQTLAQPHCRTPLATKAAN